MADGEGEEAEGEEVEVEGAGGEEEGAGGEEEGHNRTLYLFSSLSSRSHSRYDS